MKSSNQQNFEVVIKKHYILFFTGNCLFSDFFYIKQRMKLPKNETLWLGAAYFVILLSIALCVRDIPDQPDVFNTTLQDISSGLIGNMSDPSYFATAAIHIAEAGKISASDEWYFNLWPPGFMFMEAMIIKALGQEAPIILVLQILAVVLFSIVLVLLYHILNVYSKFKIVAILLPLLIFAFPVSRVLLLQPIGIMLGESFAVGLFFLFILLALRCIERFSFRLAIFSGLCLGLSAYFRSQFEIILLVLTLCGILLVIIVALTRQRSSIEPSSFKIFIKTLVGVLLVAHAVTIPWRIYHWTNNGTPTWVQTAKLTYRNSVMSSQYLKSINGDWVIEGGGNLVCRIDPSTCGDKKNAKKLFYRTFIRHPVQWYSLKFATIGRYWFSSIKNWGGVKYKATSVDIIINGLFLIGLIFLVFLSFTRKVRSHISYFLVAWVDISLFSAYALIFSLAHFEVRYFYFPKIAAMTMLIIVAGHYFRTTTPSESERI
jgi:hypothetical protein